MKTILSGLFVASALVTSIAQAHVEKGVHNGTTVKSEPCSMDAGATYFENNAAHPLNERIKISVNGTEFTVGHPAVINLEKSIVSFNHDVLQSVVPTASGAKALVVDMVHTSSKEGPVRFTFIENDWKTGTKAETICENLVFTK